VVNQREVGRDTSRLQIALRNALRQAPDCILIGEIRDRETMTAAISYSLSGHLVLATLHANNSYHALGRILSFYTPESRPALLSDLAAGLRAIVSQRLLRSNVGGRVPAVEVLLNTKLVSELIEKGDFNPASRKRWRSRWPKARRPSRRTSPADQEGTVTRDEGLATPIRRPTCCGACRTT
jgi:twitching motility protein PilU